MEKKSYTYAQTQANLGDITPLSHSMPFQITKFQKVLKGGQPTKNCYEQIGL
jgi:hypothetical protein